MSREDALRQLGEWIDARGGDSHPLVQKHKVLKKIGSMFTLVQMWPPVLDQQEIDIEADRVEEPVSLPDKAEDSEAKPNSYFVTISRRTGFRRLHRRNACGVVWAGCHKVEFMDKITGGVADAVCRDCAKKAGLKIPSSGSSSSGSSSSTEESEHDTDR